MFSQSEGPQQSAPTAVTLAATAPATEVVAGTRVFPSVSSKGVAEAPASSAGAALVAVPAAAPATVGTVFPTASVGGGGQGARFCRWNSGIDGSPGNRRYCSLRCISWGGARVFSCSSGIGGNISGGTGDQRYCSIGRINKGGSRRTRVVRWSGVIGRGSGGGNVDRRYCCPCCVGGEGG